jgi:glycerophosphoryl diester phosphodiesterase
MSLSFLLLREWLEEYFIAKEKGISIVKLHYYLFSVCSLVGLLSCHSSNKLVSTNNHPTFFKEGHRGSRGLMPENTIPAMKKAVDLGANVVEVDVYLTKDEKVLVAHDPFVNINHSLFPDGSSIPANEASKYIWRRMNYSDIRKFDVGSKPFSAFPQQEKMKVYMPLLEELIDSVEQYTASKGLPGVIYNIELKTSIRFDSLGYNATPTLLVDAVMDVVRSKSIGNRFYIQSFDVRPLQVVKKKYPGVSIGFLTDADHSFEANLQTLGFQPDIYSPSYRLVTKDLVKQCHDRHIKIIPWTVNDPALIKQLISWGVDGIITDFPNYL